MSIFSEAGDSLARISGTIIAKTGEFTRIAQLTIEQKRLEFSMANLEKKTGHFILDTLGNGNPMPESTDPAIVEFVDQYRELSLALKAKKEEIERIKAENPPSATRDDDSSSG